MAKKSKTVFVCQECGYESPKWMGQCICGAWNTMIEEKVVESVENDSRRRATIGARPSVLNKVGSGIMFVLIQVSENSIEFWVEDWSEAH